MHSRAVADLLQTLFSAEELRRFIASGPSGSEMLNQLPMSGTFANLCLEYVNLLKRLGTSADDVCVALCRERPHRRQEIERVMAVCPEEVDIQHGSEPVLDVDLLALDVNDFPPGPGVELVYITPAILDAFEEQYGEPYLAEELRSEAERRVRACWAHEEQTWVKRSMVPPSSAPMRRYWQAALHEACRHGPPAIAAFVLASRWPRFKSEALVDLCRLLNRCQLGQ